MEFLVEMVIERPAGVDDETEAAFVQLERQRAAELAAQGHLIRIWRPGPPESRRMNIGIWRAADEEELRALIASLPMAAWLTPVIRPLAPHPNDPASS